MITTKKFFWYSVAAGVAVGLVASEIKSVRAYLWLDNLTSPLMSYMRSRECQRMEQLLRADCERAHALLADREMVAAAEALEREQAMMQMAVRAANLPRPMAVRYQSIDNPAPFSRLRDPRSPWADRHVVLQRETQDLDDIDAETGGGLRMTRMVPVSPMD